MAVKVGGRQKSLGEELELKGKIVERRRGQTAKEQLEITGTIVDAEANITNVGQRSKWRRMECMADTANGQLEKMGAIVRSAESGQEDVLVARYGYF